MHGDSKAPFDPQTALLLRAVAHDFNNLISSVLGHAELLEAQSGEDPTLMKRSRAIQRAGLRAVEITRMLSAAGRGLELHLETIEVQHFLGEECRRFEVTLREGIEFRIDLPETLQMKADGRALQQVVSALLSNARTWCSVPGWIGLAFREAAEGWVLEVSDSGPGFPAEFTDEELLAPYGGNGREGSGLGLWVVQRLMAAHGGSVRLRRGPGAQVVCHFPRS